MYRFELFCIVIVVSFPDFFSVPRNICSSPFSASQQLTTNGVRVTLGDAEVLEVMEVLTDGEVLWLLDGELVGLGVTDDDTTGDDVIELGSEKGTCKLGLAEMVVKGDELDVGVGCTLRPKLACGCATCSADTFECFLMIPAVFEIGRALVDAAAVELVQRPIPYNREH